MAERKVTDRGAENSTLHVVRRAEGPIFTVGVDAGREVEYVVIEGDEVGSALDKEELAQFFALHDKIYAAALPKAGFA